LPEVNLDLKVEPTIRINPSFEYYNAEEDLKLINSFNPRLEENEVTAEKPAIEKKEESKEEVKVPLKEKK
jgi:hypothetical protein